MYVQTFPAFRISCASVYISWDSKRIRHSTTSKSLYFIIIYYVRVNKKPFWTTLEIDASYGRPFSIPFSHCGIFTMALSLYTESLFAGRIRPFLDDYKLLGGGHALNRCSFFPNSRIQSTNYAIVVLTEVLEKAPLQFITLLSFFFFWGRNGKHGPWGHRTPPSKYHEVRIILETRRILSASFGSVIGFSFSHSAADSACFKRFVIPCLSKP